MTRPPSDPFDLAQRHRDARLRESARSAPFIIIDYRSNKGTWHAYWTDTVSLLGELEGTREQCIAWARERCEDIRICGDPDGDTSSMVQLGPDDE